MRSRWRHYAGGAAAGDAAAGGAGALMRGAGDAAIAALLLRTAAHLQHKDRRDVIRLPGSGLKCDPWDQPQFSPDGRFLVVVYLNDQMVLWDAKLGKAVWHKHAFSHDFSTDGALLAIGEREGEVHIYHVGSWRERNHFHAGAPAVLLRFHPANNIVLAVAGKSANKIQLYNAFSGTSDRALAIPAGLECLEWSPDGKLIATAVNAGRTGIIYIWDTASGGQLFAMKGHEDFVHNLAFSHDGRVLASTSWDGTLRLWDPLVGKQLLETTSNCGDGIGNSLVFSRDDRRLTWGSDGTDEWIWDLPDNHACRTLRRLGDQAVDGLQFSPDGRILAVSGNDVQLWDVKNGVETGVLPSGFCANVVFTPDQASLIVYGEMGARQWPITVPASRESFRFGPPVNLEATLTGSGNNFCLSRNGKSVAIIHPAGREPDTVTILDLRHISKPIVLKAGSRLAHLCMSPDGRLVAASMWNDNTVQIWNAFTGKLLHKLNVPSKAGVEFSPDGNLLITGSRSEFVFWAVGSWKSGGSIPRERASEYAGCIAYVRNGSLLAITYSDRLVRLLDAKTLRELATLQGPNTGVIFSLAMSSDGALLAVGSWNGTVKLWDLRNVRKRLADMRLDWNAPPLPQPAGVTAGFPFHVEVVGDAGFRK